MKLLNKIALNMSWILFVVLSLWAVLFYYAIMKEVNDEIDDSLEGFSELVITRTLAGMDVPRNSNGTNNQYYLREVSEEYVNKNINRRYLDSLVYIVDKRETEPARVLRTYFKDATGQYQELLVATPTIEKEDLQQAILEWIFLLWISLLLVMILLNIGMFRRNMRPLYRLLRWLDKYKIGEENDPLKNDTSIIEFRKLNEAAMRNAKRAEALFDEQKHFIGNASHEIQTPLAICRNRLELLMEDERLAEEHLVEIDKVLSTLNGITRLNKSLLLLSKIDNRQFKDEEPVNINNLVKNILPELQEIFGYLDLSVSIREKGVLILQMNEVLAGILIMNLLKNAFIHNIPEGQIIVEIDSTRIEVRNTGVDKPLDKAHIFARFYHTRKKEGSSGLGLAILMSVCKLYRFTCDYFFINGMHVFFVEK